jgi:hypothetical protein
MAYLTTRLSEFHGVIAAHSGWLSQKRGIQS